MPVTHILKAIIALCIIGFETNTFALATNLTSAKDTTITGDKELHTEYDKRVSSSKGFFSSKTTTTITNNASNTQVGSTVSGDSVNIASNQKIDIIV